MRSVKSRKPERTGRAKPDRRQTRKSTRGKAPTKKQVEERLTFGRRAKFRDDLFARAARWLRAKLAFRRPMLYLTGGLTAFACVAALFAGGYVQAALDRVDAGATSVSDYAGFGIGKLNISGENRTPPETILAVLNYKPGQSIFGADLANARARLMELPWVKQARVARRYPDSISVSIVERRPFALWQSPKGLEVIERSGRVITRATRAQFPHLPIFAGDPPVGGDMLYNAILAHRAIAARMRIMERVGQRRWNLVFEDGVVAKLPETGWQKQLDVLEGLIVDKGVLERDIKVIDLRTKDNFFFELRQEKPQPATRGNAA
jgi:cell division protein FtsQ